jgi:hypothetical protein
MAIVLAIAVVSLGAWVLSRNHSVVARIRILVGPLQWQRADFFVVAIALAFAIGDAVTGVAPGSCPPSLWHEWADNPELTTLADVVGARAARCAFVGTVPGPVLALLAALPLAGVVAATWMAVPRVRSGAARLGGSDGPYREARANSPPSPAGP